MLDASRNGQKPWNYAVAGYGDDPGKGQVWCNPPNRGLGARPQAVPQPTAYPQLNAYLLIKTPGQSEGQCNRDITGSATDPEWGGMTDPAAGDWFPQRGTAARPTGDSVSELTGHRPACQRPIAASASGGNG